MKTTTEIRFGPFHLDVDNARLRRGCVPVPLKPKVFDVLAYLARNPDRLITQDELIRAIWPDTIVGDSSLKSCIRQIRLALNDDVRSPKYIETVHRRGYTFIAEAAEQSETPVSVTGAAPTHPWRIEQPPLVVGRQSELRQLHEWYEQARGGRRQLVFVTGGPGSGKTALTEAMLHRLASDSQIRVGLGQCLEQFGTGEAYLPILEALSRLARGSERDALIAILAAHAPTWLAHLPNLMPRERADSAPAQSVTPERMLREMAEALERFAAERPLILVLEDLHWADFSTLDLLSALARRREPAQLMVLATFRPEDVVVSGHPLERVQRDLQARGLCRELPLGQLSRAAVDEYLRARCPEGGLSEKLSSMLHRRTEGQPLFLVNVIDDWIQRRVIAPMEDGSGWQLNADVETLSIDVPDSVRSLSQKQMEQLTVDELRTLEGASVAGVEFAAAAAAAAVELDAVVCEDICERLSRQRRFLVPSDSVQWPDGTVSARYRFQHDLLHRIVAENTPPARRRRLHQRLAERLEVAFAGQTHEVDAELALHFEQGTDAGRALAYLELAAHRSARLFTHREAIDYLRRGLAVLPRLPAAERVQPDARLQIQLGLQLQITGGFADPQARRAFARARDLCRESTDASTRFPATWGLWLYHKARSELSKAAVMADELFRSSQQSGDTELELQAHQALAVTALCAGDPTATREHMEQGIALYDPSRHQTLAFRFGQDPGVACRAFGSLALWLLGSPDQAVEVSREASRLSHELMQPSSQALALHFAAMIHQCRGEALAALRCADLALKIATEQGHSFWQAGASIMRGWAIAEGGDAEQGIELMREGLAAWDSTGSLTYRTYYLAILAEAIGRNGDLAEAGKLIDEAIELVVKTSERFFEAELHRLRGEFLLRRSGKRKANLEDAQTCFRKAVAIARKQKAKSLELRALASLAKVDDGNAVRMQLARAVAGFAEESETRDLREARRSLS